MYKRSFWILVSVAWACVVHMSAALAAPCPDGIMAVDFGRLVDGGLAPGGPQFAIADEETTFLQRPPSCQRFSKDAAPLLDKAGQPMPLVATLAYDPALIASDIESFGITRVSRQTEALAALNAPMRQALQNDPNVEQTNGAGFACYSLAYPTFPALVCDLDNPFESGTPIHMSCEESRCTIILIPMSADMAASADWRKGSTGYSTPHAAGRAGASIVSEIHHFLTSKMVN